MGRLSLIILVVASVLTIGCQEDKKTDTRGPRITGGTPVDSKVGPEKPTVGGQVKPGQ